MVLNVTARLPDLLQRARRLAPWPLIALLCACASTTVSLAPSPQAPLCDRAASALVLWAPQWRPDQKDAPARTQAAAAGLRDFLAQSGCFADSRLQQLDALSPQAVQALVASQPGAHAVVLGIEVQELGPTVQLLASPALLEGGTEVRLRVVEYAPPAVAEQRSFTLHWRHGGPGVVKGVSSLPADLQAALRAGLQPQAARPGP